MSEFTQLKDVQCKRCGRTRQQALICSSCDTRLIIELDALKEHNVELEHELAEAQAWITTLKTKHEVAAYRNICTSDYEQAVECCHEREKQILEMSTEISRLKQRNVELEKKLTLIGEHAVTDWDDATVGEVDQIVSNGRKYKDWLREVLTASKRKTELERELAEVTAWKNAECSRANGNFERLAEAQVSIDATAESNHDLIVINKRLGVELVETRAEIERLRLNDIKWRVFESRAAKDEGLKCIKNEIEVTANDCKSLFGIA